MVPDLALGVFAFATSTGDLWGDGDAVGFPVVSHVLPVVDELLVAQDMESLALPNASFLAAVSGLYCTENRSSPFARTITVERIPIPQGPATVVGGPGPGPGSVGAGPMTVEALVLRQAGSPSKVLRYDGAGTASFRQTFGPEKFMPIDLPPCHDSTAPGQNLCPMSCGRRMFRGSGERLEFGVDETVGVYHGKMRVSGAFVCHKYGPPGG